MLTTKRYFELIGMIPTLVYVACAARLGLVPIVGDARVRCHHPEERPPCR
jgi:hypothetical protein